MPWVDKMKFCRRKLNAIIYITVLLLKAHFTELQLIGNWDEIVNTYV